MKKRMTEVTVGLGERSYPIQIGSGLIDHIGDTLCELQVGKRYGVISDEHVADLYGQRLMDALAAAGLEAELITFPRGEAAKNLQTIGDLSSRLARLGFDRGDALVALGGGVSGDICGFLASIYMRGIPFVQVPTTLLAQVDSSVGGKTGVDIPEGKNLVGTFYQPRLVLVDLEVLTTLPDQEFLGGMAEVIKYGVIWDAEFFSFLEKNRKDILARNPEVLVTMISRCCAIKAAVVEQDEREGGLRRILNFGHTIGHAVEAASDFTLIHGLAVAIGMRAAADLAVLGGRFDRTGANRLKSMLMDYGFSIDIPASLDPAVIKEFLKTDKKSVGGRVFFVLPEEIGRVRVTDDVRPQDLDRVLSGA